MAPGQRAAWLQNAPGDVSLPRDVSRSVPNRPRVFTSAALYKYVFNAQESAVTCARRLRSRRNSVTSTNHSAPLAKLIRLNQGVPPLK